MPSLLKYLWGSELIFYPLKLKFLLKSLPWCPPQSAWTVF